MKIDCRALVFKALCALDEAYDEAAEGRVYPSFALRFALAFLYAVGDRRAEWFDREPYDEFWREATVNDATWGTPAVGRMQKLNASFNAIARAAGLERDPNVQSEMRDARKVRSKRAPEASPDQADHS